MTSSRFRSLNAKLLAIYVPLVCLAVLILFAGLELRFYTSERNKLAASAQNIADVQGTGIGQAAWEYDEEQIQAQLSDLERLSQVQGAIVYDTSGQVLGRYGNPDEEPNRPDFRVERDLFLGHGSVREPVGHFVVTVHAGEVRKQLIARLKADGLILAVLAVALVGVTQVATGFVITRPLSRLRAAIERTRSENVREPVAWESADELGEVVRAYNEMQGNQAKAEEEVKRYQEQLEDMVAQRTDELRKTTDIVELQHRSAVVANEATSFDEAMQTGLDAICAFTGWPVGHAYIRSPERADLLIPSNHWHLSDPGRFASFREVTEKSTFTTGIGLPGRILASGRPAWIVDVTTDPNFPRAKSSEDIGVKGAFALPVLVGSDVVAVLEFFSPEAANPDDTLLQTLEHIGTQLGRVAERSESERQLLEARDVAETATEAKAAFLATMSHEIRTPMTGVIGMVDMLVHTKLDDDQRQMMRTVRDSAYALLTIINDILDFSKIEAGKLELEAIPFSIRDTVEGVSETLRPNASNKGIRINVHVDPDIPDAVLGDQVRIRQILFNMAGNAVKFTEEGRVRICAFLGPTGDEKKATVRFEIIDTGIGISKEAQADLFTEFSQAESSTTRRFGGTGLGLSICQRLTEMMGGKIEVESELEKGSTFIVTLILPIAEEHAIKSDGHDLSGLNILIVSDDAEERELDAKYLRHWGAEVTTIGDIGEAKPLALEATGQGTPFDTIALGSAWSIETQVAEIEAMQAEKDLAGVRFVLMTQTRTKAERKDITNTLYVESDPLRRTPFIRAVAVAAGRASPDISYEDEEIVVEAAKAPTIEEAEAAGTLILVAEDNKTNQNVIRRQLNLLGYAAEMADDGKQALEAMKSKRYAVLLTDCHMPEMDGFELTQTIRKAEKDGDVRLPIIAITASVLVAEIDRCYEAGMDDSLLKPLELPKVKAALRKWMPVSEPADDAVREEKVSHSEGVDAVASSDGDGPIDPSALKSVEL